MRLGTAALTLTVALTFVGLASAQESGNWFTRWFTPTLTRTDEAKKADVKDDAANVVAAVAAARLKQAKADLERRREVCLKLREIAIANSDDDLQRKAEMLDQRAYELFLAAKNQTGGVRSEVQKGAR